VAYKSPNQLFITLDLYTLSQNCDWFIAAGDFNAKHPAYKAPVVWTGVAGHCAQFNVLAIAEPSLSP